MSLGDDPHFSVVLPSGKVLCYTVQGDHHCSYNLLSNSRMQMNAKFVPDSKRHDVTWIGSLGMAFHHKKGSRDPKNDTFIRLESQGSIIAINSQANLSARNIDTIRIKKGVIKISETTPFDGFRYPSVHFVLEDLGLGFSVMFKKEHLDLFWHSTDLQREVSQGLIGK